LVRVFDESLDEDWGPNFASDRYFLLKAFENIHSLMLYLDQPRDNGAEVVMADKNRDSMPDHTKRPLLREDSFLVSRRVLEQSIISIEFLASFCKLDGRIY